MANVTALGVTADEALWRAIGAEIYRSGADGSALEFGRWQTWASDREILIAAALAQGLSGAAVLVYVEAEVRRRRERDAETHALGELAKSVGALAAAIGAESAESLVRRMPERLRPYVEEVFRKR